MKKFFKGIGAALGYFALYLLIIVLVTFIAGFAHGFKMGFESAGNPAVLDSIAESTSNYILENSVLLSMISAIITLLIYFTILAIKKKSLKTRLDLNNISFKLWWPILPFGITLNIFVSNLVGLLPISESVLESYSDSVRLLMADSSLINILYIVLVAPIFEEILFRGLIMKSLNYAMPQTLAIIIQALLFGVIHGHIVWICYAAFLGTILALIKVRYNSLFPSIILHILFNAANYILEPIYSLLPETSFTMVILLVLAAIISVFLTIMIFNKTKKTTEESVEAIVNFE